MKNIFSFLPLLIFPLILEAVSYDPNVPYEFYPRCIEPESELKKVLANIKKKPRSQILDRGREVICSDYSCYLYFKNCLLGEGGYKKVFLGVDVDTKDFVAVQIFFDLGAYKNTAETQTKLYKKFINDSTGIFHFIESFQDRSQGYFITTLYKGDLLRYPVKGDSSKAYELLSDMALAVDRLHYKNFVHLDIKPENFLFRWEMDLLEVDIADFDMMVEKESFDLSRVGGTRGYRAPELFSHKLVDYNREYKVGYNPFKADIFALGMTFIDMLLGVPNNDLFSSVRGLENNRYWKESYLNAIQSVSKKLERASVSERLEDLILSMVDIDPRRRPDALTVWEKIIIDSRIPIKIICESYLRDISGNIIDKYSAGHKLTGNRFSKMQKKAQLYRKTLLEEAQEKCERGKRLIFSKNSRYNPRRDRFFCEPRCF